MNRTGKRRSTERQPSPVENISVLIVEDHRPTLDCWRSVLELRGARVAPVASVREARRTIEASGESVDAVVLDYLLPDGDAIEIVEALARRCCAPALVLATGISEDAAWPRARRLRADRLVLKPVDAEVLVGSIVAALAAKRGREVSPASLAVGPEDTDCQEYVDRTLDLIARDMFRRAGLTNPSRALALWNRVQGRDDADTARELGIKEGSVRTIVQRACEDVGADDCRDLLRIFLREVSRAAISAAAGDGGDARAAFAPILDALTPLPASPPLRVGGDASGDARLGSDVRAAS